MNTNSDDYPVPIPFNKYFDHTLLKADATSAQLIRLFEEAAEYQFASVCVNSCHVTMAKEYLSQAAPGVKVTSVVGFPLGASSTAAKIFEAERALNDGADEIDMVINIGAAREGNWDFVLEEIKLIADLCHDTQTAIDTHAILKVIIETCLLTDEEISEACCAAKGGGADFVKTSTGFAVPSGDRPAGATVHDVEIMKKAVGDILRIKASGGIRTLKDAKALIAAGADRLGCSASAAIMEEYKSSAGTGSEI